MKTTLIDVRATQRAIPELDQPIARSKAHFLDALHAKRSPDVATTPTTSATAATTSDDVTVNEYTCSRLGE